MRTIIIHGPPGSGKSLLSEALRRLYGCEAIVEEWVPGCSLRPGALHLTSQDLAAIPSVTDSACTTAEVFSIYQARAAFDEQQMRLTRSGSESHTNDKPTNPKDAVGIRKWRQFATVPMTVIAEVGAALFEGARKYGRHNYRVAGVRASVYVDAAIGHIAQWWEGEDRDPDTGLSHITKAMASLVVLRDAMIQDMLTDDRPPAAKLDRVREEMQEIIDRMFERYPDPKAPYTQLTKESTLSDWLKGGDNTTIEGGSIVAALDMSEARR